MTDTFKKSDAEKPRYDLIPPKTLKLWAKVLTYGANKYEPNNWRLCDDPSRYVSAAYRHLVAWQQGEKIDPESGLPHLAHVLANVAFLNELEKTDD